MRILLSLLVSFFVAGVADARPRLFGRWQRLPAPAAPSVVLPVAPSARACDCGPACGCGCQAGAPCNCAARKTVQVVAPAQSVAPVRVCGPGG